MANSRKPNKRKAVPRKRNSDGAKKAKSDIDLRAEIARLQSLEPLDYALQRAAAADKLDIGVGILDTIIKQSRKSGSPDQGKTVAVVDVEPWPDPVDGAVLLDEIANAILDHLVLIPEQADAVAIWSVYTHAFNVWRISPRLGFRAASKGCGKTEGLRRLKRLVARPASCENLTMAVLFRLTDAMKPTLLIDELDNLLKDDKSALLGIMNSGYEREGKTYRCVGDQNELRTFSTFAPMAYAMIGGPPGTFDSRTITIEMRRATPTEASQLRSMEDGEPEEERFKTLGRKAARWVQDSLDRLTLARPDMAGLVNRAADNWRPLFAVADVAGGDWSKRARTAARALVDRTETHSVFEETLEAIKTAFGEHIEIASKEMVECLIKIEGGAWAEWGHDKMPITQNALARLLKPHKVFPVDVGPEHGRRKGYKRPQFERLFEAYLKHSPPPSSDNRASAQTADGKSEKFNNDGHLRGCADADAGYRQGQGLSTSQWGA